jgi:hypothetical protein
MRKIIKWLFYKFCVDKTYNKWRLYTESKYDDCASKDILTSKELIELIINEKFYYYEKYELSILRKEEK